MIGTCYWNFLIGSYTVFWAGQISFSFLFILFYMLMFMSDDLSAHAAMETVSQFSTWGTFSLCGLVDVRFAFFCESAGQGLSEVCNHELRVWASGRNFLSNICFSYTAWPPSLLLNFFSNEKSSEHTFSMEFVVIWLFLFRFEMYG